MTRPAHVLAGRRVVVTRPRESADGLVHDLERRGAVVVRLPVVEIADPQSWAELDAGVDAAAQGGFDWIVFTSAAAARRFGARVAVHRARPRARVAAVGDRTAGALRAAGIEVDLVPSEFDALSVAEALPGRGTLLWPRVEGGPRAPVRALEERGWAVREVVAYVNRPLRRAPAAAESVRAGEFDCLTFASGSAVRAFVDLVCAPADVALDPDGSSFGRVTACLGPASARAAAEAGFRVDVIAEPHTAAGLVAALEAAYSNAGMAR